MSLVHLLIVLKIDFAGLLSLDAAKDVELAYAYNISVLIDFKSAIRVDSELVIHFGIPGLRLNRLG